MRRCLAVLLFPGLLGCASSTPAPEAGTAPKQQSQEIEIHGPSKAWATMSFNEKRAYMADSVVGTMAELFEQYDNKRYSGFGCDACHGKNMRETNFAMPSSELPALYATGTEQQKQMVRDKPEMVRFMFNKVLPNMQKLLGAEPWDDESKTGFSCFNCHPKAE